VAGWAGGDCARAAFKKILQPVTDFIQIQPIKAACIQAGTCLHLLDREENSVSKFFDFES
jgi:hypothetical protein